jgi:GT2 family glycosyltransferase
MKRAKGNYFIILDSDVIMPPDYLIVVDEFLNNHFVDCFGGADTAHKSFSNLQKAINYTMTSLLTTGGIRGSKKSLQKFEPRSFNMGISKKAFETTKGFSKIHPGEDPDLSLRIENVGFETAFIPSAAVFHKRRISLHKFAVQVEKFGMVRPILTKWHPRAAKLTFWFPTSFILFVLLSILLVFIFSWLFLLPLLTYLIILVVHSFYKIGNIKISLLVVVSVFVQFFGYGWGFLKSNWYISVLKRDPEIQFPQLFFK